MNVEQDFRAAVATSRTRAAAEGPRLVGEKEIVCQSCGGHTTFSGTLTATRCPYCATPIQRDDVHEAPARLPVDGVLPFQVDEAGARGGLEAWIKGRRGDTYTVAVGRGQQQRTETRVRWRRASGRVNNVFDDICVLANDGFDRDKVEALEPWPTASAKAFSAEYLAGHLCRTYDHDVEECFGEAERRMAAEIDQTVRRDIGGDRQDVNRVETTLRSLTFRHLLLPIWLLTVIYAGQPFQVFINGMTGEVQGQRPWSTVKITAAVVAALIVAAAVYLVWRSGAGGA